jgi:mRNA interferase RelE/StbE
MARRSGKPLPAGNEEKYPELFARRRRRGAMHNLFRNQIQYSNEAARTISKLPADDRERLAAQIQTLADSPGRGKQLKSSLSGWRSLRVGHYRVIYQYFPDEHRIMILTLGHRKDIHKKIPP